MSINPTPDSTGRASRSGAVFTKSARATGRQGSFMVDDGGLQRGVTRPNAAVDAMQKLQKDGSLQSHTLHQQTFALHIIFQRFFKNIFVVSQFLILFSKKEQQNRNHLRTWRQRLVAQGKKDVRSFLPPRRTEQRF